MARPRAEWSGGSGDEQVLRLSGSWNVDHAPELEELVAGAGSAPAEAAIRLDCSGLTAFDTLGGHLIHRLRQALGGAGRVQVEGLRPEEDTLLADISATPPPPRQSRPPMHAYRLLSDTGEAVVSSGRDLAGGVAFFGAVLVALGRVMIGRTPLRLPAIVTQLERVALRGAPIIFLISFLVGAIIAQQSIFQLQEFGTTAFVADLLGILILRELAVLLTSIMVAGRSGSSFTAELGSMKMREEVDALSTMGLDPMEVLVLPRILALMIGLPLLTFLSSMSAILGGSIVAEVYGGVSTEVFFSRLRNAIGLNMFLVGMIKAPFMALVIGMIACIEGFAVRGSADSLGQHTTASVVKSIFIVIVVDGLFAMFFAAIQY